MTQDAKKVQASVKNFANEGFHNGNHSYVFPIEHEVKDLLTPAYWANNTRSVRAGDFITVRKQDLSYVAHLFVRSVIENVGITVGVVYQQDFNEKNTSQLNVDDFKIEFNPSQKFRIVSIDDKKSILAKDFATKEEAQEHLNKLCKV